MEFGNSGFARPLVPNLQKIVFLTPRIDYQKGMHDILQNPKGKVFRCQLQKIEHLFGYYVP